MTRFKKNALGFTLIELVIVIVILGILAATAAPKFIDFRTDAIMATSQNLRTSIKEASRLVYTKAVIKGLQNEASTQIEINGDLIDIVYGYPAGTKTGISAVIEFDEGDWRNNQRDSDWHSRASTYSGAWVYWHGSFDEDAGSLRCYLRYRQPVAAYTSPVVDFVFSEC